jgi:hypothetical protein
LLTIHVKPDESSRMMTTEKRGHSRIGQCHARGHVEMVKGATGGEAELTAEGVRFKVVGYPKERHHGAAMVS